MSIDWAAVSRSAAAEHGVLSVAAASAAGMSTRSFSRLCDGRGWHRWHDGVMSPPGSERTAQQRLKAAQVAVGGRNRIVGEWGLWAWGLRRQPELRPPDPAGDVPVGVLVPRPRRAPTLAGVAGFATRCWHPAEAGTRHGLDVASVPLALLYLPAETTEARLRGLLIDARQKRSLTMADVGPTTLRHRKRPLGPTLRRLAYELDPVRADSVFEDATRGHLHGCGFRPDPGHALVPTDDGRTLEVDIPFHAARVGLECDGIGFHSERSAVTIDALRHNALQESEWLVLRVTWDILDYYWDQFIALLRRLIERRGGC